jgi:outer membrane protein assembly factor BamB
VDVEDGNVRLRRSDGKTITVPLEKLSEADQQWISKHPAGGAPADTRPAAAEGGAADWPTFRGPNRDGKSPDAGLLKEWPEGGPKLLWEVNDIGQGFSSVAVAGGMIYISGIVDQALTLFALDMNGKHLWKAGLGPDCGNVPGARATATVDEGRVYLLSGAGMLGCFDAKRGRPLWSRSAKEFGGSPGGWGYAESVLIYGNAAIFKPGGRNCIVALNKQNGQPLWSSRGFQAGPEYSSCLLFVHDRTPMIATGTSEGLVCVNAQNGAMLWANPFAARNTANCPTPAYSDGYVFWANGYGKGGVCMKLGRGGSASEAWTTRDMDCHHGGYVIHEGYIYGNNGGGWACLDLRTGQRKWPERAVGKGSLCWADGMLYLFSENNGQGALATCSPDGLKVTGRVQVRGSGPSWAHPVVIGGRLYLRYDTNLYCFDVKAK